MRVYEITNPDDQLALLRAIMDNTWATINRQKQAKRPTVASTRPTLPKPTKPKAASKPKKIPRVPAPKPLPKPKPIAPTPMQIKNQQQKNQQEYAQAVQKTLAKAPPKPLPKSMQPIPTSIISPIGGGDPDFNKKMAQAKKQGEQNRANGSLPHSY
jgi:hypothetical protein